MWKTLLRTDISRIWLNAWGSKVRFAYGLSKAKNQWNIIHLWGWIYKIRTSDTSPLSDISVEYWDIVALLIREHSPSGAIIAHEKSLELSFRNFEPPEKLVLYTRNTSKRVRILSYEFHFRTLRSGPKTKGRNMFPIFLDHAFTIDIDSHTFHTLWIEAALLDVASLKIHDEGVSEELLIKSIKKYEKTYSRKILWELVAYRYIRAMNRIRSIAKEHGYSLLYEYSLDIIKKEWGGCFVAF